MSSSVTDTATTVRPGLPVRPYLGESAKERVLSRRIRLLDTALELLASEGWRQVTIEGLCRRAKLNKRYFYETFADLDDLAAAVVDDLAVSLAASSLAAVEEAREAQKPTPELARDAISAAVTYLTDDPRRARVLFTEIAGSPRAIGHRRDAIRGLAETLSVYGHEHHRAEGTDPIAAIAAALLVGGSAEAILGWLDGAIKTSRTDLIDDLAALWVIAGDGAAARAKSRAGSR